MRASPTRIIRRRKSTARDGSFFKKENNAEQTFFADHTQNASFFQPSATINRKCDACEEEHNEVHRATDKKEDEKKIHKAADKKEEEKKIHKAADKKDEEKKIHKMGDKKDDEKKVHRSTAKEDENKYMHTQAERIADEKKRHAHEEKKKKHEIEKNNKEEEKKLHRATDKKEDDKKIKRAIEIEENEEEHNRNLPVKHGEEDSELRLSEAGGTATGTLTTSAYIGTLNSGGNKLPVETTQFFYDRMGYNFDSVNIHTGVDAAESTKEVNAKAYAIDNHIVFNEGQYNPDSLEGKKLLAHELTHVVQNGDSTELQKSPDNEKKKK